MLTLNDGRNELWQWDTNRTLSVDADCSQVHFSNKVFGRSIDVDVVDGVAIIPDILLQTDKDLNVWAFVGTAENGYTKISKTFKVNRRNKPADYVFTPTDQTTLSRLVERLDKIEEIQDPDAIKNAVEDYLEQNPVEAPVRSVNEKTGEVHLTAEDVGAISQDDLQEATNEALAQAKASGEFDGADGQDGGYYTPSVTQPDSETVQFDFTPSSEGMPTVEPVTVALPVGPEGDPGVTPEISIGTVETLDAGSDATASITGTPEKPVLNLGIPRGPAGASGSEGDTQGTLVASYTHTGNLEVAVEHIDYGTGTITAQGHGLSENDMIYATVTDAAHTAAPLAPEPYLPGGIAYATRFYAVNVTEDTFQLASAESGDPVAISEKSTSDFSRWHFERDTDRYGSSIALSGLGRFVNFRVRVVGKQVLNDRFDSNVVQGATSYISNAVDNPDGYGDSSYGIGARMMNGNIKFAFDSVVMYDGTRYRISRKGVASCNKVGDMWSVTSRDLALECVSVDCAPVPVDEIVFWNCYPANGTTVEVYKL